VTGGGQQLVAAGASFESTTDSQTSSSTMSMLSTISVAVSRVNDMSLKQLLHPSSTSATAANGRYTYSRQWSLVSIRSVSCQCQQLHFSYPAVYTQRIYHSIIEQRHAAMFRNCKQRIAAIATYSDASHNTLLYPMYPSILLVVCHLWLGKLRKIGSMCKRFVDTRNQKLN